MIIEINLDTNKLTDADRKILAFLGGSENDFSVTVKPDPAPAERPASKPVSTPAKKAAPAKPAAKPAAKSAPEKVEEEFVGDPDDDAVEESEVEEGKTADVKAADNGPTMKQAVETATKLVSEGKTADVKAALQSVGVRRVSELSADQIEGFLAAVDAL